MKTPIYGPIKRYWIDCHNALLNIPYDQTELRALLEKEIERVIPLIRPEIEESNGEYI